MSLLTSVTFLPLTFLPHLASLSYCSEISEAAQSSPNPGCKLRSLMPSKAPGLLYFPALQTKYKHWHNPMLCWYQTHEYNLHFMWKITFFSSSPVTCWTHVTTGGHQGWERDLALECGQQTPGIILAFMTNLFQKFEAWKEHSWDCNPICHICRISTQINIRFNYRYWSVKANWNSLSPWHLLLKANLEAGNRNALVLDSSFPPIHQDQELYTAIYPEYYNPNKGFYISVFQIEG